MAGRKKRRLISVEGTKDDWKIIDQLAKVLGLNTTSVVKLAIRELAKVHTPAA